MRFLAAFLICFLLLPSVVFADTPKAPSVEAQAAILIDAGTGRVLWEKNSRSTLSMASTTKIMTAIITLERGNLDEIVTVSRRAAIAPKVKMYLAAGEKIPLKGLLHALMLQSSNDAAVAIAEHIGGTVENFGQMMTQKAQNIGALDTSFITPNGLDAENHYSTAYDLAVITRYALNNPEFVKLINTSYVDVESDKRVYSVTNKNRFLREFDGAIGVKTGFTNQAGHCFVGAAERDGMKLISVVLASGWGEKGKEQKWVDTKRLMSYGFAAYKVQQLVEEGEPAKTVAVSRSKTDNMGLVYERSVFAPLREDEVNEIFLDYYGPETIPAPIEQSESIGEVHIYVKGKYFGKVNLLTSCGCTRHDLKTSLEKSLNALFDLTNQNHKDIVLPEFLPGFLDFLPET